MSAAAPPAVDDKPAHFIRHQITADLSINRFGMRRWAGRPGVAAIQATGGADPAAIRTRFPPEPNGYPHIGHVKSICLNFGLARDFNGRCHLRFDDTNPAKEDQEYVDAIIEAVRWSGFSWDEPVQGKSESNLYYASDYFELLYQLAQYLITAGYAYVDSQSADDMRRNRGSLTEPGVNSPFRGRPASESLALLNQMRHGQCAEGSHVLRARIDMASPNINLRDPVLYRIRLDAHHRTGTAWSIYPMYDYAHPVSDALENITHSICTLEFEDHRPLYDWLLARLSEGGFFAEPLPRQYEFSRLNVTYVITSKRKLQELVKSGVVDGWDDPRLPTIAGLRRRGYTPESLRLFCDRTGVSKADSWIDMSVLEQSLRDDLDGKAARAVAVLDPVELIIENLPEGHSVACQAPVHPKDASRGHRSFAFDNRLWIERDDFMIEPVKGFFRLAPGSRVRLRYAFVVECTGFEQDAQGRVTQIRAKYFEDSQSGTPGADLYKVKGNIHWLSQSDSLPAEVRLYDRLFLEAMPDAGGADYLQALNPHSRQIVPAWVEPSMGDVAAEARVQFERHGYFVADQRDHSSKHRVFNRSVGLKDSWSPVRK